LGIGDWGLGIGDWAQSPIPNPHIKISKLFSNIIYFLVFKIIKYLNYEKNKAHKIKK
jgi:hypothetical protein